jgi:hypothetical protein
MILGGGGHRKQPGFPLRSAYGDSTSSQRRVGSYCHWTHQGGTHLKSHGLFLGARIYSVNTDTSGERTTGMVNKYLHVVMLVYMV